MNTATTTSVIIKTEPTHKWTALVSGVGFASGVVYAFANKTGFWKGWGIAIIGGIAGVGIGKGLDQFSKK